MHRKDVLIYNGPGAESTDILYQSLFDLLKSKSSPSCLYNVKFVDASQLDTSIPLRSAKLLVIPGGRDLPYVKCIGSNAILNIKDFIEAGGSYLGICAGAYFSCTEVVFDENGPLEVTGLRELELAQGVAVGPTYPGFTYGSTAGSRMVPLACHSELSADPYNSFAYYNGGGEFVPRKNFTDFKTIAFYKDFPDKRAIISVSRGLGKAVLSFVHPEMSADYLKCQNYSDTQWTQMTDHKEKQRSLFKTIISELLL